MRNKKVNDRNPSIGVEKIRNCNTVSVPESLQPVFNKAQEHVHHYFQEKIENPEKGMIEIQGERYILVRAASMSKEFFDLVNSLYQDRGKEKAHKVAAGFLFDLAHALGKADAKSFHAKMKVTDPIEKLSIGPVQFAYSGWAFVKILPHSSPSPDENYCMIYDHPFSFESDIWLKEKKQTDFPVCIMSAGYSSGWCEESFGMPLVAVEVECRAKGDDQCRFIMAPPTKIEAYVTRHMSRSYKGTLDLDQIGIPEFFKRKRLEDELRKSEETARALLNAPDESALLLDTKGTILALNEEVARRFGMKTEEMKGKSAFELLTPELAKSRLKHHETAVSTGQPVFYRDKRENRWLETHLYPIRDTNGKVIRIAVYSKDITDFKSNEEELKRHKNHLEELVAERTAELEETNKKLQKEIRERKRAEKDLQNEKERLSVTLQSIGEGVAVTDIKGRVTSLNPAAEMLSGWSQDEAAGESIDRVMPVIDIKSEQRKQVSIRGLISQSKTAELIDDILLLNKNGKELMIVISKAPIKDRNEKVIGFIFVFRDITEAKKVEEELLRQSKIESIGILAGGIAHDFNNLLTGILGNISLLKHETDKNTGTYERLLACEKAGLSAKRLTHQLLTFSKGGEPVKKVISLEKFLKDTVEFVLSGASVRGIYDIPGDIWTIEVDEGQFSQVINNLVINSLQAMPAGGKIRIKAENIANDDERFPLTCEKCVKITIADEGCGIATDDLVKVFDPYFTTKETGSGLGLATVYSIIKKHNGHIGLDSCIGKGTVFYIYLPAALRIPGDIDRGKKPKDDSQKGRVLLMDDEEIVRDVGKEMLEAIGYDAAVVPDGKQAIEAYKEAVEAGSPYDVVIMDLTIPGGMGGKETIQALRVIDPQVTAIVSSGFSNDPVMANFETYGFKGVMVKPYRLEEMIEMLEKI